MTEPGWVRRLTGYCLRHRGTLVTAFGAAILVALIAVGVPLIIRRVVDEVLTAGGRAAVGTWVWSLVGLALLRYQLSYLSRYRAGRLCLDVVHDLRVDFFTALGRMDGAVRDRMVTGQVISRAISDLSLVQGLLSVVPIMVGNVLLFVVSLLVMAVLSPVLTTITLLTAPALWWVADRSRRRLFAANRSAQQLAGELVSRLDHAITGVRVVKGFGQEDRELREMRHTARKLFAGRLRVVGLQSRYSPTLQAIPTLGQVGVLLLGGWLALQGRVTLGTFLAFAMYLGQLVGPVRQMMSLLTMQQRARAGIERVFEIIDTAPAVRDPADPVPLGADPPDIEFDRVHFGYGDSREVLSGLSMTIPAGKTTALIGRAGSGKSTVTALLARYYDPDAGGIRINGVDLRRARLAEVRAKQGVVFQNSFLFSDTIRANIAYGNPDATDEQVRAAARTAEAEAFIEALPDGYQTVIGERGLTLSGGQRQRIALARALLPDPALLVLDDATSAVDPRTEAAINATLRTVTESRTTLLITHRHASLALADHVIVLDDGKAAHSGTVAELQASCALFRALFDDHDPLPDGGYLDMAPAEQPGEATAEPIREATVEEEPLADPRIPDSSAEAADPRFGLARLLRPFWPVLTAGLVLVCLDAVAQLIVPALVRTGVDQGVTGGSLRVLLVVSAVATAILLADWAIGTAGLWVTGRTGERLLYLLRVKAFAHLQRLGLDYYERELSGRIMTRMTTDIDALSEFLQTAPTATLVSLLTLLGVLVALLVLDAGLAMVVLAMIPLMLVATWLFRSRAVPTYVDARAKIGVLNAQLQENVAGLPVTQFFGRVETNRDAYARASWSYRDARLHAHRYLSRYFPFVLLLSDLAGAVVLGIGATRLHDGSLSAGVLIAFFLYLDLIFAPVQQLAQIIDSYRQAAVGLARLRDLLRTPTSTPVTTRPGELTGPVTEVAFRDVRFAYPDSPTDAVTGLNLVVGGGETVALVGETGAGKSTVMKLLARFYDVTAGSVRVNGIDLRELDLHGYRRRIGVVSQEPYLSPGTVRDAIAYGRPEAIDAEITSAARTVGAHRMIASLPGGYRYQVGEQGRNLSSGQRQLLALARAELVAPEILLLDEATAALDAASEAEVAAAMARLARRCTTILVAHRLHTAAKADRIVMMAGGRIIEVGRHADLLAADGPYAALWSSYSISAAIPLSENSDRHRGTERRPVWPIQQS